MDVRRRLPATLAAALLVATGVSHAEELWVVHSGKTAVNLYESLLTDLGMTIEVNETAADPTPAEAHMEPPFHTFAIAPGTDLTFRVRGGLAIPRGVTGGTIQHDGGFAIRHEATGYVADLNDFIVDYRPGVDGPRDAHVIRDWLFMHAPATTTPSIELLDSEPVFDRGTQLLDVYNLTLAMSEEWAKAIDRPDLAGQTIGTMYVHGETRWVSGVDDDELPPQDLGTFLDVELGFLYSVESLGHSGTFPNGTAGISMSTTSCNPGDIAVPWRAAMQENHPVIAQQFYRVQNGLLEQIGTAWVKHGFFALSSNECGYGCSGTDGTSLGVGCSDTYGTGNNGDRYWLGPRNEVNPYTGEWECTGSFFAEYQPDCIRREDGTGWGPVAHRVEVADQDLGVSGAEYYFEGYYVVRADQNKGNNLAYRRCTTSWTGGNWNVSATGSMTQTPVILSWGDTQSTAAHHGDGEIIVASRVVDLGGGSWRYQYNVFNRDSDRQMGEFHVPVGDATITNVTFHDWDALDTGGSSNEWTSTVAGGEVAWSTTAFEVDPSANALSFGLMFTFAFTADEAPNDSFATIGYWKPGTPTEVTTSVRAPFATVAVGASATVPVAQLANARPNPFRAGTTIQYVLGSRAHVDLSIYDAQGRLVRNLVDRTESVGVHEVTWDGRDAQGVRVAPGAYFQRIDAGGFETSKSLVVVD